ncbi:tetratricopeptide repeat protein [Actinosynnema sp. CA-248983]
MADLRPGGAGRRADRRRTGPRGRGAAAGPARRGPALTEALDLYTAQDNRPGVANTRDSLGLLARRTGRHADSREHYESALALFRELGHSYEEANTLERLGHVLTDLGDHNQARTTWQEALRRHTAQHRTAEADRVRAALQALDPHPAQ